MDPDIQEDRLSRVIPRYGGNADSYWHLLMEEDPTRLLATRRKQKIYLARYARQSVHEWEDREVSELQEYFLELSDLISNENDATRATEER